MMSERRRLKQTRALEDRLAEHAKRLREEAQSLPPGAERDELSRISNLGCCYLEL